MTRLSPAVTWSISIVLALLFAAVGSAKLWGPSAAQWATRFSTWGLPPVSQVVGILEMVGGLALLLPRTRKPAAGLLVGVMAGALGVHLVHLELLRIIPPLIFGFLAFSLYNSTPSAKPLGN